MSSFPYRGRTHVCHNCGTVHRRWFIIHFRTKSEVQNAMKDDVWMQWRRVGDWKWKKEKP